MSLGAVRVRLQWGSVSPTSPSPRLSNRGCRGAETPSQDRCLCTPAPTALSPPKVSAQPRAGGAKQDGAKSSGEPGETQAPSP